MDGSKWETEKGGHPGNCKKEIKGVNDEGNTWSSQGTGQYSYVNMSESGARRTNFDRVAWADGCRPQQHSTRKGARARIKKIYIF